MEQEDWNHFSKLVQVLVIWSTNVVVQGWVLGSELGLVAFLQASFRCLHQVVSSHGSVSSSTTSNKCISGCPYPLANRFGIDRHKRSVMTSPKYFSNSRTIPHIVTLFTFVSMLVGMPSSLEVLVSAYYLLHELIWSGNFLKSKLINPLDMSWISRFLLAVEEL